MNYTTEEEFWAESAKQEKAIKDRNDKLIKDIGVPEEEMKALLDCCIVTGEMEIVGMPKGDENEEDYEFFEKVFVDQKATPNGESGDYSYAGHMYARFGKNKYLKIPYEC